MRRSPSWPATCARDSRRRSRSGRTCPRPWRECGPGHASCRRCAPLLGERLGVRPRLYLVLSSTPGIAMRYSSQVKPISYLKAHAAEVLTQLASQRQPLVITQNGEAKAVLQDVASFEETQETLALLKVLALGNEQVAAGKVK